MATIYSSTSSSDSSFSSSISSTVVCLTSYSSSSKSSVTFGPSSTFFYPGSSYGYLSLYLMSKTVVTLTTHLLNLPSAWLNFKTFSSYSSYLTISESIIYYSFEIES